MVALLEAQGAVGLGDQPIAADQGVTALPKPVECEGAPFLWCHQRSPARQSSITPTCAQAPGLGGRQG
jgi:hypothetical protein